MTRKKKAPQDDPEESKRFIDMAREIEADERPETFERVFRKVVAPPTPKKEAVKKR